jgi:lipoyl(octanoyl) transferase
MPACINGALDSLTTNSSKVICRDLGLQPYLSTWHAMQRFTHERKAKTIDEIWLVEHPPIYTLGQAGKTEHILAPGNIPIQHIDRGGQVTYHGPGQLIVYTLLDIRRLALSVRQLVTCLEQAIIQLLAELKISAYSISTAPGVYVHGAKICALGLRIRRGCCYHGLALNVDMDLEPYQQINPCGQPNLPITQLKNLGIDKDLAAIKALTVEYITKQLGYLEVRTWSETHANY